jgi:hypothetical protein
VLKSSDQTRFQVGTVVVVVVVTGAVVRGGVVVAVIVVAIVVGVALRCGVADARDVVGPPLVGAASMSRSGGLSADTSSTVSTPATNIRKTPMPTKKAWTLPATETSPMFDLARGGGAVGKCCEGFPLRTRRYEGALLNIAAAKQ